ncbi:MAG: SBBP repeat-containing protein [Bacteroidota bacterium]|nr:SBBP repeat-containing protein [Bacteroidota bacterium]
MKIKQVTLVLLMLIVLTMIEKLNSQVQLEWAARYNSASNGNDYARAMAIDSMGNVYVTGTDADLPYGFITLKINSSGQIVWARRYSGGQAFIPVPQAISVDLNGNVYVGAEDVTYIIVSYDSIGNERWVRRHSGTAGGRSQLYDVELYRDTGSVITTVQGPVATGYVKNIGTNWDVGTVKYNTNGDVVWVRNYAPNNSDDQGGIAMATSDQTNITITGFSGYSDFLTLSYDINGNLRWAQTWNGPANNWDQANDVAVDKNGNTYVTGYSVMAPPFDDDIVTIKYDSNGTQQWIRFYDGPKDTGSYDYGEFIKTDDDGNVIVAGGEMGVSTFLDYCTIKYDSLGNQLWVRTYNGVANRSDFVEGLAVDRFGSVYVTGTADERVNFYRIHTIKYDKDGNQLWLEKYPEYNTISSPAAIIVDKNLNVYIAGTISFNPSDIIVLKYSQLTNVETILNELPEGFALYQNYPNPFNASTKIDFRLHVSGFTSLKIYDVFGREVATLVNQKKEPGEYSVGWNADGLSSGVYYYRMTVHHSPYGLKTDTKKMAVIK